MYEVDIKTTKKINEMFQKISEKNKITSDKIRELKEKRNNIEKEINELKIMLIQDELEGNGGLKNKINNQIDKRIIEINSIDSKVEAYREYSNNHIEEADEILNTAAIEYIVERDKYCNKLYKIMEDTEEEIENLQSKIDMKKKEKQEVSNYLYTYNPYDVIPKSLVDVISYINPKYKKIILDEIESKSKSESFPKGTIIHTQLSKSEKGAVIQKFITNNFEELKKIGVKKKSILSKYFK